MHAQRLAAAAALMALVSACATAPSETPSTRPEQPQAETTFSLQRAAFSDLPGWQSVDLAPALLAFRRACDGRARRDATEALPGGGRYGGTVGDWATACAAAPGVPAGQERAFFEANFYPYSIRSTGGEARLTSYYEPIIEARRTPDAIYSMPLLTKPSDMVTVDIAAFAEAYDNAALRGAPRRLTGQISGAEVRPYPQRAQITPAPGQAFAYANPVDVYNLQIQGSGRMAFPDGAQERATFAAQNGYRWRSALAALRDRGEIDTVTWSAFRAWSDAHGAEATQQALAADPSYVFFTEERIDDPNAGPRGAAGVPLTPLGSIAVDPAYHPYGAVVFVEGEYNDQPFQRLLVAQDTGGAIRRGPLRGDVFWGSGADAGRAAENLDSPAHWWTLLPRGVPIS